MKAYRAAMLPGLLLTWNAMAATLPIIDEAWDFSDPAASEAAFHELVDHGREAGDSAYQAEALTQLARSLGLQRRFEEATAVLDEAHSLIGPEMDRPRVRVLLERGRVLNSSGDPPGSIPYFSEALNLAEVAGLEYLAVDAAHMLGIVTEGQTAIRWNETAIAMAEAAEDSRTRRWLGPLYNNLAWTHNDTGQHAKALALFEKDIEHRQRLGQTFEESIARWSRGKTLRLLGRVDEALQVQLGLVDHPGRQGNPAEGYTHEEIGECLLLLDQSDAAAPHFAIAHALLSTDSWLQANEPLARLEALAAR